MKILDLKKLLKLIIMNRFNSRLFTAAQKISELEEISVENIHPESSRHKNREKKRYKGTDVWYK